MSSLSRKILRQRLRKNGEKFVGKPQPTILHEDGGYSTLRPTKGWLRVSGKRVT